MALPPESTTCVPPLIIAPLAEPPELHHSEQVGIVAPLAVP